MSEENTPNPAASPPSSGDSTSQAEADPRTKAGTPGDRAREVQDAIEEGVHEIEARYKDVRDQLKHANDTAVTFIREHPATCIFGAVAFGYVVGRLASKRWLE